MMEVVQVHYWSLLPSLPFEILVHVLGVRKRDDIDPIRRSDSVEEVHQVEEMYE